MSQKLELLNGLDKFKKQQLFQEFIVEMGISKHIVHIPLTEAVAFETVAAANRPGNVKDLKSLVVMHNGTVEE